jgi:hypothetical protein
VVLGSTCCQNIDARVARNPAKVLDQPIKIVDERRAIFGAEDDVEQVKRVGVGHTSNVVLHGSCVGEPRHDTPCRR